MSPTLAQPARHSILRFGDCELHLPTRELWLRGSRQPVRRRVFELIVFLIGRRPATVSHEQIAKAVWDRAELPPGALAKAVLEARRASGDDGDEPTVILSVRGVGYRFAGLIDEGVAGPSDALPSSELAQLHAALVEGQAAAEACDAERAQFLCDRALVLADASRINRERVRALVLASLVAMIRGTLDKAAGLATQALRLAEQEGHQQLAAVARLRLARVHSLVGDLHGALAHVHAVHGALQDPESLRERRRCESIATVACRELGDHDQALVWAGRALQTARLEDPRTPAFVERMLPVSVHVSRAESLLMQGRGDEARASYQQALALNDALRPDFAGHDVPTSWLPWLGNQALALAGVGRPQEAWEFADAIGQRLQDWPEKAGPNYLTWLMAYHELRGGLLADTRRFEEAIDQLEQGLALARQVGQLPLVASLLGRAARACEQAGRYRQAYDWLRERQAALGRLQSQRAEALASVLQAQVQADSLRRELQDAREQARRLALENHQLAQRLSTLESASLQDDAGYTDPMYLRSTLAPRHADARQRDVPCCLALLAIDNQDALARGHDAASYRQLLRELAQRLSGLLPPGQAVSCWRPGLFVFALDDMGLRRALVVCTEVEARLNGGAWPDGAPAGPVPRPRFSVRCADAAQDETLDLALQRLQALVPRAGDRATAEG